MLYDPPSFDENLWITLKNCCEGHHYLLSNPHTFPGRMNVWCPVKRVVFRVSKSEIKTCSLEAEYWIKGFLAGNEPDAPRSEDGDYLSDDDPRMSRWQASIQQFSETGLWVAQERFCDRCGSFYFPHNLVLYVPHVFNTHL